MTRYYSKTKTKKSFKDLIEYEKEKKCFLKHRDRELLREKHIYAYNRHRISDNLYGQDESSNVITYLFENDPQFHDDYILFRSIINNGFFNPYKEYLLRNYFVKPVTYNKFDQIFRLAKKDKINANIIHIGEKGSGKTALQNCWLHDNNEKLEENNIFWVRCDAHKLYRLWLSYRSKLLSNDKEGTLKEEKLITIKEYLDIQLLYVFAKYCCKENRKFFTSILKNIKISAHPVNMPNSTKLLSSTVSVELYSAIKNIEATIDKEESSQSKEYSYAFDHVMKYSVDTRQLEKRKWLAISDTLQKHLDANDIKILKMVDGIDNIDINSERSVEWYEHMIQNAHQFIRYRPRDNQLHFIAVRERTNIDIKEHSPIQEDTNDYIFFQYKIENKCADFKEILQQRVEYATSSLKHNNSLFWSIAKECIQNIDENCSLTHHNNIRSFLYNKATLIAQVYYRIRQLKGKKHHIPKRIEMLEIRNKYLNGRLFLRTKKEWSSMNKEMGLCCMNIFYFDSNLYQCTNSWHGLVKTRILQLLIENTNIKHKLLKKYLVSIFEYPENLVKSCIKDLRAFGMIDSKYNDYLYYEITPKGRLHLSSSYSNIDTLYYFALDSALPKSFVEHKFINSHKNKYFKRTDYPYSSFSTVTIFVLFLLCVCKIEAERLKNKSDEAQSFELRFSDITLPMFKSPLKTREFIETMNAVIDSADHKGLMKMNNFLEKISEIRTKALTSSSKGLAN